MKIKLHQIIATILIVITSSCNKFLEEKSDSKLTTPTTIEDFKALLSDAGMFMSFCSLGESSSDSFFLTDEDYNALYYESDKRLYTWQPDYVSRSLESAGNEWQKCYSVIYVCNSIIQGIEQNNLNSSEAQKLKGQALVYRAARYLDGVQIWAPVYNGNTADKDLGMVLRLDPDMNIPSVRTSVRQTYDQILTDLTEALPLLSENEISKTLPGKGAAYGLLARTYLIMGNYEKALENAIQSLRLNNEIIDFNSLNATANFPIPVTNYASKEVIFDFRIYGSEFRSDPERAKMNHNLMKLYEDGDLRKTVYYQKASDGSFSFKGTHTGSNSLNCGISTTEMVLIAAESNTRLGNLQSAAELLNSLLIKRYTPNSYTPVSFQDQEVAIKIILQERQKELVFRGLRWSDIKRLNRDGANIILTRTVNNKVYTLDPNDKKYAVAIPEDIIEISKIIQNPR